MKRDLDDISVDITYKISSNLGCIENNRYNQTIVGNIIEVDNYSNKVTDIGYITANKLLLGEALNNGWNAMSIFDCEQHLLNLGELVYDFGEEEWSNPIREFYDEEVYGDSVLILTRIEIFPNYRGMGIGKYVIKDLYNNFIQGAALLILKCFPLQNEAGILENDIAHADKMKYKDLEKDKTKAFKKLHNYYKGIGFQNIPTLAKEYMFINPRLINRNFGTLKLE